jgi:hypothetical protein
MILLYADTKVIKSSKSVHIRGPYIARIRWLFDLVKRQIIPRAELGTCVVGKCIRVVCPILRVLQIN